MSATQTTTNGKVQLALAPRAKGFPGVCCLGCGEETISVDAADLTIRCSNCDSEMSIDDVRERLAGWGRFLSWLDLAPEVEE